MLSERRYHASCPASKPKERDAADAGNRRRVEFLHPGRIMVGREMAVQVIVADYQNRNDECAKVTREKLSAIFCPCQFVAVSTFSFGRHHGDPTAKIVRKEAPALPVCQDSLTIRRPKGYRRRAENSVLPASLPRRHASISDRDSG